MANVVEVQITGKDLTQPATQSATKNLKSLDKSAVGVRGTFSALNGIANTLGYQTLPNLAGAGLTVGNSFEKMGKATTIAFGAVGIAAQVAYALAMNYFEKVEAEAQKRIAAMDTMIKAVEKRQDLLDPDGAGIRAIQRGAAGEIQGVKASGASGEDQEAAIRQIQLLKDQQLIRERMSRIKKMADEDVSEMAEREASGDIAAWRNLAIHEENARYETRLDQIKKVGATEAQTMYAVAQARQNHEQKMALIDKTVTQKRLAGFASYAQAVGGIFGSLATIAEAQGKKGFKMAQMLRYGEAIINTAAGVARALAEFPWPYSVVVGATVAAAGAAQIAVIASQKAPQAHSGLDYVPQDATYKLKQGEMVLDPGTSEEVRNAAKGGGFGMATVNMYVDGVLFCKSIGQWSRDGMLSISLKALS